VHRRTSRFRSGARA